MDASQKDKSVDDLVGDFVKFFSALNPGKTPYQWQRRLLRCILENDGSWPAVIDVPTGAGKTVAIEMHLFLNAIADECELNVARRLIATVNRRALVDKQYAHACAIQKKMADALAKSKAERNKEDVLAEIAKALLRREEGNAQTDSENSTANMASKNDANAMPFDVVKIRGGLDSAEIDRDWRIHPTRPAILCMTPEMFGSRLLFRGYGTSRYMRPVEAGLLAYDSVLFLDESHLNRQLLLTARQIQRLEAFAEYGEMKVRPLQVCASSATPDRDEYVKGVATSGKDASDNRCIKIEEADFKEDKALANRMKAPKPVKLRGKKLPETLAETDYETLKKEAVKLRSGCSKCGAPVACVFNSPKTACKFADMLEGKTSEDAESKADEKKTDESDVKYRVLCIVGNMRQHEGDERREILSDQEKLSDYDFVVGTQAIEVGIDADFSAMLTELASTEALIQRAGRVNRFGKNEYEEGTKAIVVWRRKGENTGGIYSDEDLAAAWKWLSELDEDGLTPWAAQEKQIELAKPKRADFERLELADAEYFSKTSENMAPESDMLTGRPSNLDLWLADDFDQSAEVYFAVRHRPYRRYPDGAIDPIDDDDMVRLLEELPPINDELVACPIGRARDVVKCLAASPPADDASEKSIANARAFLLRADERPIPLGQGDERKIAPGSVVVVDESAPIFLREIVYFDKPSGKDVDAKKAQKCLSDNAKLSDDAKKKDIYLEAVNAPGKSSELGPIRPLFFFEPNSDGSFNEMPDFPTDAGVGGDEWVSLVWDDEDPVNGYCCIRKPARKKTVSSRPDHAAGELVYLKEHQEAVEARVGKLAEALGLPNSMRETLRLAGDHHDDGKKDPRFQELLRRSLDSLEIEEGKPLAKGGPLKVQKKDVGLSKEWRHEQLSAVHTWVALAHDGDPHADMDEELAVRLVGTNHGHGRTLFRDSASELLPGSNNNDKAPGKKSVKEPPDNENGAPGKELVEKAENLFDAGLWDELVYSTDARYGYWGIAYLEALLRAADAQVSSEEGR